MKEQDQRLWEAVTRRHKERLQILKGTDEHYQMVADCDYLIEIVENLQNDIHKILRFKR